MAIRDDRQARKDPILFPNYCVHTLGKNCLGSEILKPLMQENQSLSTSKGKRTRMQDHRPVLRKQAYGRWGEEPLMGHYYDVILLQKLTDNLMFQVFKNRCVAACTKIKKTRRMRC